MDKKSHVQGFALYLEYEKSDAVQQVLMTPDGFSNSGTLVPAQLFRRRMNPAEGKKQWKVTHTNEPLKIDVLSGETTELGDQWPQKSSMRLNYAEPLFDAIVHQGWSLRLRPLVFEVSQIDLDDIEKGKTPYKLMYRMQQCRLKAGFPVDAVAS